MKNLIAVLVLFFFHIAAADETGHPVTLWEVEGDSNSVYLLGSIHLLRKGDYPLPRVIDSVYDEAEVLIMEVDMDDLDPMAAQAAFTRYGVLQDGRTLADLLGAEAYQDALAAAEQIEIPLSLLDKTEPWYAALTIEIMMLGRLGFDPSLGVETHMMSLAGGDGKPIEGLETIEEQIRFLDGMSLEAQRDMLLATLEQSAEISGMMDGLINAWRHGDVAYLEENMLKELASNPELEKVLVTNRNNRWVEQIGELLDDGDDYLIIVGALHLVGEDGVPQQLSSEGYAVRQLSESADVR